MPTHNEIKANRQHSDRDRAVIAEGRYHSRRMSAALRQNPINKARVAKLHKMLDAGRSEGFAPDLASFINEYRDAIDAAVSIARRK